MYIRTRCHSSRHPQSLSLCSVSCPFRVLLPILVYHIYLVTDMGALYVIVFLCRYSFCIVDSASAKTSCVFPVKSHRHADVIIMVYLVFSNSLAPFLVSPLRARAHRSSFCYVLRSSLAGWSAQMAVTTFRASLPPQRFSNLRCPLFWTRVASRPNPNLNR